MAALLPVPVHAATFESVTFTVTFDVDWCPEPTFSTSPADEPAWKKARLQKVWLGTSLCQWSHTANWRASERRPMASPS